MPRVSIDYMNARREIGADKRKGKTIFAKASHAVDTRDAFNAMDVFERALEIAARQDRDFRSWFRNLPTVAQLLNGELDDLTF